MILYPSVLTIPLRQKKLEGLRRNASRKLQMTRRPLGLSSARPLVTRQIGPTQVPDEGHLIFYE